MAKLNIKHIVGNTYYIPSATNVGVYIDNGEAILIDSGNDKETARQILKLLNANGWALKLIVNTHSNADHIGGNAFLQKRTSCMIAATQIETAFIRNPDLEVSFLYGGFPYTDLHNKFLLADASRVTSVISDSGEIPGTTLQAIPLPGHFFGMIGVKTPDNVVFIADSLAAENIIEKYNIYFLVDIKSHLETLDNLKSLDGDMFIPSHGEPLQQLAPLIAVNKRKINEIGTLIKEICEEPSTDVTILSRLSTEYDLKLNPTQYNLFLSTVRSYISYLYELSEIEWLFEDARMKWKRIL